MQTPPPWNDDDRLGEALGQAIEATRAVPPEFVQVGKALFTWYGVDAELANLTYDSALENNLASSLRAAEPASLRALILTTPDLTVELGVEAEALVGQLSPPSAGTAECLLATGDILSTSIDQYGAFVFRPVPSHDFRLWCRPASGLGVITGLIKL
jgi:hypothetical protein